MSNYQLIARNTSRTVTDEWGNTTSRICIIHNKVNLYEIDRVLAQCKDFFSTLAVMKKWYPMELASIPLVNQFEIYDEKGNRYDCIYHHRALYEAAKNIIPPVDGRSKICFRENLITREKKEQLLNQFKQRDFVTFVASHPGYFSDTMKQEMKKYSECAEAIRNQEGDGDTFLEFSILERQLKEQLTRYKVYRGAIVAELHYQKQLKDMLPHMQEWANVSRERRSSLKLQKKSTFPSKRPTPMVPDEPEVSFSMNPDRLDERDLSLTEEEIYSMYGYVEEPYQKQKRMCR